MTDEDSTPVTLKPLPPLKVGDKVIRYLCGTPIPLVVLKVTPELVTCGYPGAEWDFEPKYGIEHDPFITKNMPPNTIISFIVAAPEGGEA